METLGLIDRIVNSVRLLDMGRKALTVFGTEHEGHLAHDDGINDLLNIFTETFRAKDIKSMVVAESNYLKEELSLCPDDDRLTKSSLTQAISSFDDALLALSVVEKESYRDVDKAFPNNSKYRVRGFPKDAFHIACIANRIRIQNVLKTPGLNPVLKTFYGKRIENMTAAMEFYCEKQAAILIS
jgi:hypothetical protein